MQHDILTCSTLSYILRYPDGFDPAKKHPAILYLHGSGTRGKTVEEFLETAAFRKTGAHADFPFLYFAPQCPPATTWYDLLSELKALVKQMQAMPFVDTDRIYLMGASMGAYGAWQLAMSIPEAFAAILPICGGGMYWNAKRLVNVPVWAFHGGKDKTVLTEESVKMVDAVNKAGGSAKLTIYPENTHDAWTDTYSNPEVFRWLLTHTNQNSKDLADEHTDAAKFG